MRSKLSSTYYYKFFNSLQIKDPLIQAYCGIILSPLIISVLYLSEVSVAPPRIKIVLSDDFMKFGDSFLLPFLLMTCFPFESSVGTSFSFLLVILSLVSSQSFLADLSMSSSLNTRRLNPRNLFIDSGCLTSFRFPVS